ncbi:MAG: hypothetical protein JKP92_00620 [Alphaproteobacteria bacterium]|jgi:hypothetical protein|nr:hypothetical protein [Alphaproteobacteria bacterium]
MAPEEPFDPCAFRLHLDQDQNLQDRSGKWVTYSGALAIRDAPWFAIDMQHIGMLDVEFIAREIITINIFEQQRMGINVENNFSYPTTTLCLLKLWIFGLYELLRSFREHISKEKKKDFIYPYEKLENVFSILEIIRMPLAKYQLNKERDSIFWEPPHFDPYNKRIGWEIPLYKKQQRRFISRREISDLLLDSLSKIHEKKSQNGQN